MATKTLFTLPILPSPEADKGNGTFICTSSKPGVYLLTFTSPADNRLNTAFCQSFILALDIIEHSYEPGVVITTSGIPKFYSNGLDIEHVFSTKGFFEDSMYKLFNRLLTYPMPTIALVNGHAFAGGFMVAMCHDYRVFNASRGFLCLNELDLNMNLQPPMTSIFRQKVTPIVYRSLVLEAKRFGAKEALEAGLVDVLGGLEETNQLIEERKLVNKGKAGPYRLLKRGMYGETLAYTEEPNGSAKASEENSQWNEKRVEEVRSRVAEWERNAKNSKL